MAETEKETGGMKEKAPHLYRHYSVQTSADFFSFHKGHTKPQ